MLSAVYSWPHVQRRDILWRLQAYLDVDLETLPLEEQPRLSQWIDQLVGEKETDSPYGARRWGYWLLHATDVPGAGRQTVVITITPPCPGPGLFRCRIRFLDSWGHLSRSMTFNVGHSMFFEPAAVTWNESQYSFLCLTVETSEMMGIKRRQLYRITDNYVEMIRSEHSDGTFAPEYWHLIDIKDKPPDWSEWELLLESPDRLQQARGLAAFWFDWTATGPKTVDDKLQSRLAYLAKSSDRWVSEESTAALAAVRGYKPFVPTKQGEWTPLTPPTSPAR